MHAYMLSCCCRQRDGASLVVYLPSGGNMLLGLKPPVNYVDKQECD